jgi:hypothetical protein
MAVRNLKLLPIEDWTGFNQFTDAQEVPPNAWVDSLNVVVTPNGNPVALRSPANYNPALATTNKVLSAVQYDRTAGALVFYDINATSGANVATYSTDGSTNTSRRTAQADARWQSLNINDALYRVNGTEFIQYNTNLSAYAVGITAPASAPTASIVAGGSGTLDTGVYVSYAYHNTTTGHIGECSAQSGLSGATGGGSNTLRVAVTASAQTGVDKIVLFISEDGGTVRYLLVDTNGDMQTFNNTTGNIDVSVVNIFYALSTEETAFNSPPPSGITFIGTWKNRIIGAKGRNFYYSGFDQISAGVPQEAWPPLNVITVPTRSATAKGGIDTPIGWLALSDQDAYLLSGEPTDKIDSGQNVLQITEQFDQLGWKLGTRSPLTIKNTPYGTVWLDQNKHLQFWNWEGQPEPMALGVWPDLAAIQNTDAALAMAEAEWFGAGGSNGGFYILTASTTGSTNNRCWIIMMIQGANGLRIVPAPSSIAAQCVFVAKLSGKPRCFIGVTDRLREILDFDLAGAGWASTDRLYFDCVVGNNNTNFNRLHSLRFAGSNAQNAIVRASDVDGSNSETLMFSDEQGDYLAVVDRYGPRHRVSVNWPNDDAAKRTIQNMRFANPSQRRVV